MKMVSRVLVAMAHVYLLFGAGCARAVRAGGRLDLQVGGGRFSLDAQACTVKEVLDALVAKNAVRVTIDEASAFRARLTSVNMRFGRRDMAAGLDAVLAEIPHELVKNADGTVAEVRLISPLMRGRGRTATVGVQAPGGQVDQVPEGPTSSSHTPTVRSAGGAARLAALVARQGASGAADKVAATAAPVATAASAAASGGAMPGELAGPPPGFVEPVVPSRATQKAARRLAPRPPIANPVSLTAPSTMTYVGGLEVPGWASPEEKAAFPQYRADLRAGKIPPLVPVGAH